MKTVKMDAALIISVMVLVTLGVVMVYSASALNAARYTGDGAFFVKRQILFALIGLVVLVAASMIPYEFWKRSVIPMLLITIVLLAAVIGPLGHRANGASRWFRIGPFSLQVAEFAKLVVVMYMARYLGNRGELVQKEGIYLIRPLFVVSIMIVLVLMEPDLGTAIFIGLLAVCILFAAGVRISALVGLTLAALPVIVFLIAQVGFRMQRIKAFLNPWEEYNGPGFQLVQSFVAFGQGGLFGTGVGSGKSKLFFLPESHTDFILAVVGEELGFIGVAVTLSLFAVFLVQGMKAASKAPDPFGTLLAAGLTVMIGLQVLINCMVALGLLPTKGMPLPFVSYGGSSLIASMAAAGIVLNVSWAGRTE